MLKIALVKDKRDANIWGGRTTTWDTSPELMLESYTGRPQCWGLIRSLHADVLVIDVGEQWYRRKIESNLVVERDKFRQRHWNCEIFAPMDDSVWYENHINKPHIEYAEPIKTTDTYPAPEQVCWGQYDVVLCSNPFLSQEVIASAPLTLFSYWNHERFWEYYQSQKLGTPFDLQYDLHLDHLEGPEQVGSLPQTLYFPYITNSSVHLDFQHEKRMFMCVDHRTLVENRRLGSYWSNIKVAGIQTQPQPSQKLNGLEYHRRLARTKYFVYVRNHFSGSGQAAIEAASHGAIVIGYHWGKLAQAIIHPACIVRPPYIQASRDRPPFGINGCPVEDVVSIIENLEASPKLQHDVRLYQKDNLDKIYEERLNQLRLALAIKRGENRPCIN